MLSPQSMANLRFAENPSLLDAIRHYPAVWPPLYPILLWFTERLGLPIYTVNILALCATAVLLWLLLHQLPLWLRGALIALFLLRPFVYTNSVQLTAETILLPLALATFWLLLRYRKTGRGLAWLCLVVAAAGASRWIAAAWLVPICAVVILAKRQALQAAVFTTCAIMPVVAWAAWAKVSTGFWSGMDRAVPRVLPPELAHWHDLAGFLPTVACLAKTAIIDIFSPVRSASHAAIDSAILPIEWMVLAIVAVALVLMVKRQPFPSDGRLSLIFCGWFVLVTIALWSFGNNDPLYSRFLYPCWPFVWLALADSTGLAQSLGNNDQSISPGRDACSGRAERDVAPSCVVNQL